EVVVSWSEAYGDLVLRTELDENGEGYTGFLTGGAASEPIAITGASQSAMSAFLQYLVVGFDHILPKGLDHILFVIGLFLLSTALRPLLIQITAFTLAHTVTLALGAVGWVNIPGSIVEPLIALSIAYVAVENIFSDKLHRWRPVIVFLFGLLHGLGFAGVLSEFGFAPGQFIASLIAFNIGVEIGQLVVIALCFLIVGIWFGKKPWYRERIVYPASLAIGGYALVWVIERSLELELPMGAALGVTLVLGLILLFVKGWRARSAEMAYVLSLGLAGAMALRMIEGAIG
ncbi:MAG: HupE/UreJ family protein, partial [Pseudomonadota bacterium]